MKCSEIEHVLRAAKGIAGEDEFILIGSQSVLGAFPDAPLILRRSIELDIYPKHHPEKSDLIDGAIGERSLFHENAWILRARRDSRNRTSAGGMGEPTGAHQQ